VSKVVHWNGKTLIGHLIQKGVNDEGLSGAMWQTCLEAFVPPIFSDDKNVVQQLSSQLGKSFVHNFIKIMVCDKATLQPVGPVVDASRRPARSRTRSPASAGRSTPASSTRIRSSVSRSAPRGRSAR
jgi:hypothetical protein